MRSAWRSAIRAWSFLRKDLVETVRQPRLFAALVLAPFLVLLLFGIGLKDSDPLVRTVFVVPQDETIAAEMARFASEPSWRLRVEEIGHDIDAAIARLERGEVDLVVMFPEDAVETVRGNQRTTVLLFHNLVDPIEARALQLATRAAVDRLNRQLLRGWVVAGQERTDDADERVALARERVDALREAVAAGDDLLAQEQLARLQSDVVAVALALPAAGVLDPLELGGEEVGGEERVGAALSGLQEGLDTLSGETQAGRAEIDRLDGDLARLERALAEFQSLRPDTLVSPFQGRLRRYGTVRVDLSDFFAPAVLVLLVQHMLVTLVGLSLVRDEELGTNELFRVAPLRTGEALVGKYLAYLLLSAGVSALLIGLLVWGLGVPLVGSVEVLVISLGAVLFTSIGMGFLVALLARTDSQAVQYAMMVLLASIFLTGFLIGLERIVPSLRALAWLLPATYGITLLRDVMLRGTALQPLLLLGLVGIGVVLLAVAWRLLRRRLEPAGVRRR